MKKQLKIWMLCFGLLIGIVFGTQEESLAATTKYVTASTLSIRMKATSKSKEVGKYKKGTKVTCYGTKGNWTKVKYNGKYRYVYSGYLSSKKSSTLSKGQQIANYAKKFIGNPYKWGGTSLTKGADCSGFTKSVYKKFNYSLPHSSISQRKSGKSVKWSSKKPGDLICYQTKNGVGHVGIYIGNNKVVHAGSSSTGIHISKANYRAVHSVRRIAS